ncbi:MAG: hypothetical protein ABI334_03005 [Candidatus Dormiibacterota bacterium]
MTDDAATALIREAMPLCATLGIRAARCTAEEVVLKLDWAPGLCTTGVLLRGGEPAAPRRDDDHRRDGGDGCCRQAGREGRADAAGAPGAPLASCS